MDAPFTWFSIKNASYILAYIFASTYLGFEPSSLAILISLMLTDVAT